MYKREYYENSKASRKIYVAKNREFILAYQKEWRQKNKAHMARLQKEWRDNNKDYVNSYQKEWSNKNPSLKKKYAKNANLKTTYNITLEQFNEMREKQDYCCLICKKHESEFKRGLSVDHDHATGEIRGLLCDNCNGGLGKFKDNILFLQTAIDYLNNKGWIIKNAK